MAHPGLLAKRCKSTIVYMPSDGIVCAKVGKQRMRSQSLRCLGFVSGSGGQEVDEWGGLAYVEREVLLATQYGRECRGPFKERRPMLANRVSR